MKKDYTNIFIIISLILMGLIIIPFSPDKLSFIEVIIKFAVIPVIVLFTIALFFSKRRKNIKNNNSRERSVIVLITSSLVSSYFLFLFFIPLKNHNYGTFIELSDGYLLHSMFYLFMAFLVKLIGYFNSLNLKKDKDINSYNTSLVSTIALVALTTALILIYTFSLSNISFNASRLTILNYSSITLMVIVVVIDVFVLILITKIFKLMMNNKETKVVDSTLNEKESLVFNEYLSYIESNNKEDNYDSLNEFVSTKVEKKESEEEKTKIIILEDETLKDEDTKTYKRSFMAKLSQAKDELKKDYSTLKNKVMSYKNVSERISFSFETINKGRTKLLRFGIKGKTLYVYFNLTEEDIIDKKINYELVDSKKYEDTPLLIKIKNPRRFQMAEELIDLLSQIQELDKIEEYISQDYYIPYMEDIELLEKGLIKEIKADEDEPIDEIREDDLSEYSSLFSRPLPTLESIENPKSLEEPIEEEPIEEEKAEEIIEEAHQEEEPKEKEVAPIKEAIDEDDDDLDLLDRYSAFSNMTYAEKYLELEVYEKKKANELSIAFKSNPGVKETITKKYVSYSYKNKTIAKIMITRGKVKAFFATDANDLDNIKYYLKDVSSKKAYETTPSQLKLSSARSIRYAKELFNKIYNSI